MEKRKEDEVPISDPQVKIGSSFSYFQNTFIPRYNDLVDIVDKKASTCLEVIRFLEPLIENEKTYAQGLEKILSHKMCGNLSFEESGIYDAWGAFQKWVVASQSYSNRSYIEFKTAKDEFYKSYVMFDNERKKVKIIIINYT